MVALRFEWLPFRTWKCQRHLFEEILRFFSFRKKFRIFFWEPYFTFLDVLSLYCCLASIPNPKILTFFRIRKVAHVQKTFFDWQTHSAVRYWWLEPNPIYRIEFGEKLENIQPVCCTDKFHTQKRAHLRPVTLKKRIRSSSRTVECTGTF